MTTFGQKPKQPPVSQPSEQWLPRDPFEPTLLEVERKARVREATGREAERDGREAEIGKGAKEKASRLAVEVKKDTSIEDPIKAIDGIDITKDPEKDPDQKPRYETLSGVAIIVLVKLKKAGKEFDSPMDVGMIIYRDQFDGVELSEVEHHAVDKFKQMIDDRGQPGSLYFAKNFIEKDIEMANHGGEVARRIVEQQEAKEGEKGIGEEGKGGAKEEPKKPEEKGLGSEIYDKAAETWQKFPGPVKWALAGLAIFGVGKLIHKIFFGGDDEGWKKKTSYAIAGGIALGAWVGRDKIGGFFGSMGINISDNWKRFKGWIGSLFGDKPEEAMEKLGSDEKNMYKSIGTYMKIDSGRIAALKDANYDNYCNETDTWWKSGKSYLFSTIAGEDKSVAGFDVSNQGDQIEAEKKVAELLHTYRNQLESPKPKTVGEALSRLYLRGVFSPKRKEEEEKAKEHGEVLNPDEHLLIDHRARMGLDEFVGKGGSNIKTAMKKYKSGGDIASNPGEFITDMGKAALKDGMAIGVSEGTFFLWNGYTKFVMGSFGATKDAAVGLVKLIQTCKFEDGAGLLKEYFYDNGMSIIIGSTAVMSLAGGAASIAQQVGFKHSLEGLADPKKGIWENTKSGAVRGLFSYGFFYPVRMVQAHGAAIRWTKVRGQALMKYDLPINVGSVRQAFGLDIDTLKASEAKFYGKQFLKYHEMLQDAERTSPIRNWKSDPLLNLERRVTFFSTDHLKRTVEQYARFAKDAYDRSYGIKDPAHFEIDKDNLSRSYEQMHELLNKSGVSTVSEAALKAKTSVLAAERVARTTSATFDESKVLAEHGIDARDPAKVAEFWEKFDRANAERNLRKMDFTDRPDAVKDLRISKRAGEIAKNLEMGTYTSKIDAKISVDQTRINTVLAEHGITPGAAEAKVFLDTWAKELADIEIEGKLMPKDGMPEVHASRRMEFKETRPDGKNVYRYRNIDVLVEPKVGMTAEDIQGECMKQWKARAIEMISVEDVRLDKATQVYEYKVNGKWVKGNPKSAPTQATVADMKEKFILEFGADAKAIKVANLGTFDKICEKMLPALEVFGLGITLMIIYRLTTAENQKEAFVEMSSTLMSFTCGSKVADVFVGNKFSPPARAIIDLLAGVGAVMGITGFIAEWIENRFKGMPGGYAIAEEGNALINVWSYKTGSRMLFKMATKAAEKKLFTKVGLEFVERGLATKVVESKLLSTFTNKLRQVGTNKGGAWLLRRLGWRGATTAALLADDATIVGVLDDAVAAGLTITMGKDVVDIISLWRRSKAVQEELAKRDEKEFTQIFVTGKGKVKLDADCQALGHKNFEDAKTKISANDILTLCERQDDIVVEAVREGFTDSREIYSIKKGEVAGVRILRNDNMQEIAGVSNDDADKIEEALKDAPKDPPQEAAIEHHSEQQAAQ